MTQNWDHPRLKTTLALTAGGLNSGVPLYVYVDFAVHYTCYVTKFGQIKLIQIHPEPRPIPYSLEDCGWVLKRFLPRVGLLMKGQLGHPPGVGAVTTLHWRDPGVRGCLWADSPTYNCSVSVFAEHSMIYSSNVQEKQHISVSQANASESHSWWILCQYLMSAFFLKMNTILFRQVHFFFLCVIRSQFKFCSLIFTNITTNHCHSIHFVTSAVSYIGHTYHVQHTSRDIHTGIWKRFKACKVFVNEWLKNSWYKPEWTDSERKTPILTTNEKAIHPIHITIQNLNIITELTRSKSLYIAQYTSYSTAVMW